jgi:hypothetical protein
MTTVFQTTGALFTERKPSGLLPGCRGQHCKVFLILRNIIGPWGLALAGLAYRVGLRRDGRYAGRGRFGNLPHFSIGSIQLEAFGAC